MQSLMRAKRGGKVWEGGGEQEGSLGLAGGTLSVYPIQPVLQWENFAPSETTCTSGPPLREFASVGQFSKMEIQTAHNHEHDSWKVEEERKRVPLVVGRFRAGKFVTKLYFHRPSLARMENYNELYSSPLLRGSHIVFF